MIIKDVKYSLQDFVIVPEVLSSIEHRGDIKVNYDNGYYPLITSPMESVISQYNYQEFEKNHIMAVIPRTTTNPINARLTLCSKVFCAFSLSEAEQYFVSTPDDIINFDNCKICIDMANGHMKKLYDIAKQIKDIYPNCQLMVGNIANPKTYAKFAEIGVDYIRCGIGVGSRCFRKNTKIKTSNGYKNIENINIGDIVYTHTLSLKPVKEKFITQYSGEIYKINNEIECTPNHKFYVINKSDKDKINNNNLKDYAY